MITSLTGHTARKASGGLNIVNKERTQKFSVALAEDGLTLKGDGFDHSITVAGERVTIHDLSGRSKPASFDRTPYLEGAQRTAAGVASILTGIPVNIFQGGKAEPVYMNLSNRLGMGYREDGSRMGGRYRVDKVERELDGTLQVHGKAGWSMTMSPHKGIHSPETTEFADRAGWSLSPTTAFHRLTGNVFGEQIQGGVAEIWREAGRPDSVGQAAKVADYVFDTLYRPEENYTVFRPSKESEEVLQELKYLQRSEPEQAWDILSQAAAKRYSSKTLLKKLKPD
jgi:hypothetical protein